MRRTPVADFWSRIQTANAGNSRCPTKICRSLVDEFAAKAINNADFVGMKAMVPQIEVINRPSKSAGTSAGGSIAIKHFTTLLFLDLGPDCARSSRHRQRGRQEDQCTSSFRGYIPHPKTVARRRGNFAFSLHGLFSVTGSPPPQGTTTLCRPRRQERPFRRSSLTRQAPSPFAIVSP
jgi:hypothetical protein